MPVTFYINNRKEGVGLVHNEAREYRSSNLKMKATIIST